MNLRKNKKGFTFVELIVAVFIFSLMMISVAGIFSSSFGGYRNARIIQKDLEDAQFIMNQMAKTLRTSSVIDNPSGGQSIVVFDYSQERCLKYAFANDVKKIKIGTIDAPSAALPLSQPRKDFEKDRIAWCTANKPNDTSLVSMAAANVTGKFFTTKSDKAGTVGKVTISMTICSTASCSGDTANIQSSISLRDYYNSGI